MRKTDKLYYQCAYTPNFTATIVDISETYGVALNQTRFYPGGGGQPADFGTLDGIKVVDCASKDGIIYHKLETTDKLAVGAEITGVVDIKRRLGFMQNHTGEHILSGYAKSRFGAENVGFHMSERGFTMDLNKPLSPVQIQELEDLTNAAVNDQNPVITAFYEGSETRDKVFRAKKTFAEDEQVRIVTVDVYDVCACAGLHVSNTEEIGFVKVVGAQNYKGGVRLTVYCGQDAFWDYSRKHAICRDVGVSLSADTDNITIALEKLMYSKTNMKKQLDKLRNENMGLKAQTVGVGANFAYFFEEDLTSDDMRRFANLVAERAKIAVVMNGQQYAISAREQTALEGFVEEFTDKLEGRGGLSKLFAQGAVKADYERIVAFLENRNE
ncbi:MAG: alanine--tRNA ligase-related protein [Defluviitaleaceae bacterium]|nr:alanine--tRNA ligase-related protein [Defluviitaleaceae bacterium]